MQCSTKNLRTTAHNSAQLRCFENGNDDFGVEAFWIGDAARVGYFVPLNGPLNGHPPSIYIYISSCFHMAHWVAAENISAKNVVSVRALSRMLTFVAGNICKPPIYES